MFDGNVYYWSPNVTACTATSCANETREPDADSHVTKALQFALAPNTTTLLFTNISYLCPNDTAIPEKVAEKYTFDLTARTDLVHYIFMTCYYDE